MKFKCSLPIDLSLLADRFLHDSHRARSMGHHKVAYTSQNDPVFSIQNRHVNETHISMGNI